MKFVIRRGTHEIGGNCVEVCSGQTRIIIDLGLPLVDPRDKRKKFQSFSVSRMSLPQMLEQGVLPAVKGLYAGQGDAQPPVDAFLLSHPHQDHYGLCKFIRKDVPVYLSQDADLMLGVSDVFLPTQFGVYDRKVFLKDRVPVMIGDFKITPYLMDHSGYGALAFLVEADGKKLFYSGDFRGHGRKSSLFKKLLRLPPRGVDALLMEGTMVDRTTEGVDTERQLESRIVREAVKYPGMKLIQCSGQNIDRVVTFYRAAKRSGAALVMDLYVANVIHELGRKSLPNPLAGFADVKILFTKHFMKKLLQKKNPAWFERWRPYEISATTLKRLGGKAFVFYRERSEVELERAGIPSGSVLFYSQWSGYMAEDSFKPTEAFCKKHGIAIVEAHTSGHAVVEDLQRLEEALNPKKVIPIHSNNPEKYNMYFGDKVVCLQDGEVFEVI